MSNSNSSVDRVVVIGIELVGVQWHRIEDIYQFGVDVEKYMCRLSGIQRPSCKSVQTGLSPDPSLFPFPPCSFLLPSTGPFRESCPLRDLRYDESVLSFSSPHHPPAHGPRALSPASPLSAKEFGLRNCSSFGLCEKFARPQLQRHCRS